MWNPFRRKNAPPLLRDFVDLTGFSKGSGLSTPLSAHAALRRIDGWVAIGTAPIVNRLSGLRWQSCNCDGQELEKSRFVDLLHRPNPEYSGGLLLRKVAQTLVLAGEGYLIIRRGRRTNRAAELWAIEPSRVARVWEDGSLFFDVSPGLSQDEPERLSPEDVVRIYRPRPDDLNEPYGVAHMAWKEVMAEQGWAESVVNWFEKDARPTSALEFPNADADSIPPEWFAQYVSMWSGIHSRREGSRLGVPVPLPPGSTLKELSGLGESENLGPTETALRNKILAACGTPAFLVGFSAETNRASSEAALFSWDFNAVQPWAHLIVDAINFALGDEFAGETVRFREWIHRDRAIEAEIDEKLLAQLVVSPNEVRHKRGMPPASWGELPIAQDQDQPFDGSPKTVSEPTNRAK